MPGSLTPNSLFIPYSKFPEEQFSLLAYEDWILIGWSMEIYFTQLVGALEYTNSTSAEGSDHPQRVFWYDTKQSDGEAPVML